MTICVAVTDSAEGRSALHAATAEAALLNTSLVAVNLTAEPLDTSGFAPGLAFEEIVPSTPSSLDEVEQVLQVLTDRPEIDRLVVGVRKRSPVGKAVLGSIAQRLILEASIPVLSVKASEG